MHWALWAALGLLAAAWVALREAFRRARLPVPVARLFGRLQFGVWRWTVLEPLYPWVRPRPWTRLAPGLYLGKSPLARHVSALRALGVTRVLNMQDEYAGPEAAYRAAGIVQLRVPVVDHYEPSPAQLHRAVDFVRRALCEQRTVYVHCQGGHGRSAAVVFAHLALERDASRSLQHVNEEMSGKWRVRTKLHSQPAILQFLAEKEKETK